MDCLEALTICFLGRDKRHEMTTSVDEKGVPRMCRVPPEVMPTQEFVETMRSADDSKEALQQRLHAIVSTTGWTERFVEAVLHKLEKLLMEGAKMGATMRASVDRATALAREFAKEHPVYTALIAGVTLIALGVLVELYIGPWVISTLGFTADGPLEGSFAARWMSQIAQKYGNVEKGSLYAYLQHLAMS